MSYEIKNGRVYDATGSVAIIVSPEFGAGWSTWNRKHPECLFDPDCVMAILCGGDASTVAEEKWPDGYWSADDLEVRWLPQGTRFYIDEYDGAEGLVLDSDGFWTVA